MNHSRNYSIGQKLLLCTLALTGLLVAIAPSSSGDHTSFTFSTINLPGFAAGAIGTSARGINNSGQVVGDNGIEGFLYNKTGQYSVFNVPFQDAFGVGPRSINASGIIVGYFTSPTGTHGFIKRDGTFTRIDVPGGTQTDLKAVNNRGEILGFYQNAQQKGSVFLLKGGAFTIIGAPASLSGSPINAWANAEFSGMNDSGHIVGTLPFVNPGLCNSGFVYMGGALKTIDVPDAKETFADGINNHDQIVGYYRADCMSGFHYVAARGFLYVEGRFQELDVPGAQDTWPHGIDDSGRVVGTFSDGNHWHGFIATPDP
jgi:hypothetical protein